MTAANTTDAFERALDIILHHEGGFVNDPADPGGMTNLGVTRQTWQQWTGKPASETTMRKLTRVKVSPLYKARYWDAVAGDRLPPALALCVFDFGVNAGPGRAARMLQAITGAGQDGAIGPDTLAAVERMTAHDGLSSLIWAFQNARRDYYRSLRTFKRYGKGWLRRVDEVETVALELTA